jgi:hypothetical protein
MIKPDLKLDMPSPWEETRSSFWSPSMGFPWSPTPIPHSPLIDLSAAWGDSYQLLSPSATGRQQFVITVPDDIRTPAGRLPSLSPGIPHEVFPSETTPVPADVGEQSNTDRTIGFCPRCRQELENWFWEHIYNPYPPQTWIKVMAAKWRLSERQIRTFFTNHRVRYSAQLPLLKKQWALMTALRRQLTFHHKS